MMTGNVVLEVVDVVEVAEVVVQVVSVVVAVVAKEESVSVGATSARSVVAADADAAPSLHAVVIVAEDGLDGLDVAVGDSRFPARAISLLA